MLIAVYKGLVKISMGRDDCGFLKVYKIEYNKKNQSVFLQIFEFWNCGIENSIL